MNKLNLYWILSFYYAILLAYAPKSCSMEEYFNKVRPLEKQTIKVLKGPLPEKLNVGYANWHQCDEKILEAAINGVNVIIWFSVDLAHNATSGRPYVNRGPDPDCVARIAGKLRELELETVHLISIGGWNSPHPDTRSSPAESFQEWHRWNEEVVARPQEGFYGYDGFDWDIEGHDDMGNPGNRFTVQCLDFMGAFSQLATQSGYIVSMAPAESYLDPMSFLFDRNLTHAYPEWEGIILDFNYHGHNPYSYLISRYGNTSIEEEMVPTFAFVTIQLYEGYSHALFNTTHLGQTAADYILKVVKQFERGWFVEFSSDPEMDWLSSPVRVEPTRLVIGLANGWADNSKFLLLPSWQICLGYKHLQRIEKDPRGFAFWNIADEGRSIPSGELLWLAKDLDSILKIRHQNYTQDLC